MKKKTNLWIIVGLLALAGALIGLSQFLNKSPASPLTSDPEDKAALLTVAPDDYTKGAASSTVVLVEYLDFECPSCAAYAPIVKRLETEYGDRVTFVTRYFPLPGHRNGLTAAYAVEAAAKQGKFWEMHDLLFASQKQWAGKQVSNPSLLEPYAEQLGLNMEQFRADAKSAEVKARVQRDFDSGMDLDVPGTPTFFLNGEMVKVEGYESLKAALDGALAGGQ